MVPIFIAAFTANLTSCNKTKSINMRFSADQYVIPRVHTPTKIKLSFVDKQDVLNLCISPACIPCGHQCTTFNPASQCVTELAKHRDTIPAVTVSSKTLHLHNLTEKIHIHSHNRHPTKLV
jgi:hypothetical protein